MAKRDGLTVEDQDDGSIVVGARGSRPVRLDGLDALVWQLADGERSILDLCQRAGSSMERPVTETEVWAALDRLADVGLLVERAAPPGGELAGPAVGRRTWLTRLGVAGGAALAGGLLGPSTASASQSGGLPECRSEEESTKESLVKSRKENLSLRRQLEQVESQEAASKASESDTKESLESCTTQELKSKEQEAKQNQEEAQKEQAGKQNQEEMQKEQAGKAG